MSSISNSCLPPGRGKTVVSSLTALEPGVTWSCCWSSPVSRWFLDCCHNAVVVVVLTWWIESTVSRESQSVIRHHLRKQWSTRDSSDLSILFMWWL